MRLVSLKVSQTSQYRKRIIQFNNNKKNVFINLDWIGFFFTYRQKFHTNQVNVIYNRK